MRVGGLSINHSPHICISISTARRSGEVLVGESMATVYHSAYTQPRKITKNIRRDNYDSIQSNHECSRMTGYIGHARNIHGTL